MEANFSDLESALPTVEVRDPRRSERLKETAKKPLELTTEDADSSVKRPSKQGARKRAQTPPDETESNEDALSGSASEVVLLHYEDICAQDIDERRRWVEDIVIQIEQDEVCPASISIASF